VEPFNLVVLGLATLMSYFALVFYGATQLPHAFPKKEKASRDAQEAAKD
jgi:hypothetical protein